MIVGSSGNRVPVCYNHQSVVHQIAFARRLAYFFCLSKRSMEKKTPDDAGPAGFPVLLASGRDAKNSLTLRQVWRLIPPPAPLLGGTKWGKSSMRIPVSGRRYPDEPDYFSFFFFFDDPDR
jgi:hypothetical protein